MEVVMTPEVPDIQVDGNEVDTHNGLHAVQVAALRAAFAEGDGGLGAGLVISSTEVQDATGAGGSGYCDNGMGPGKKG